MKIEIYTDGSCQGNPGPGGWGVLFRAIENNKIIKEKKLSGKEGSTTNNRMELTAAIKALETLSKSASITIHTDSKYVKNGITKWIKNWETNNWKTSQNKNVKNKDLWIQLRKLTERHNIEWVWVKAHSDNEGNDIADRLAKGENS